MSSVARSSGTSGDGNLTSLMEANAVGHWNSAAWEQNSGRSDASSLLDCSARFVVISISWLPSTLIVSSQFFAGGSSPSDNPVPSSLPRDCRVVGAKLLAVRPCRSRQCCFPGKLWNFLRSRRVGTFRHSVPWPHRARMALCHGRLSASHAFHCSEKPTWKNLNRLWLRVFAGIACR